MEAVARHYWGEPSKVRGHEMRWGTYGSKSVDKRKGTFYDHEHCLGGGVVDLVRMMEGASLTSLPDLLERKFGIPKRVQDSLRPAEFLSRIYDYFDEDGVLRYQVMRYEPKRFVQRRPLEDDQWSYKMDGVEPLPFNLPAILAHPNRPVLVAEGEKCAEALIRAGFVATTNHGGANNWNPALNRWFSGRKVVVLPDNDVTGKAHAQRVVNNLLPVAEQIKLCELPGLLPKGDVADWFSAGGTSEQLTDLVKSAPVVQAAQEPVEEPAQPTGDVFPIYGVNHLTMMPPVEFLVDGLLPRNAFVVAYGLPGAGKSFFALDVGLSVAAGRSWQGLATGSGAVLYIAGEGVGGIGKRIKAWRDHNKFDGEEPKFFLLPTAVRFREPEDVEKLFRTIDALGQQFSCVIVDTVARALLGGDENSASDMGLFVDACDTLRKRLGCTLLAIHHAGKDVSRGMRGSSALLGACDTSICIKSDAELLSLVVEKQKDADAVPEMFFDMVKVAILEGSSIVLQRRDMPEDGRRPAKLNEAERIALQALQNLEADLGWRKVSVEQWHQRHLANAPDEKKERRARARAKLQTSKVVFIESGQVWTAQEVKEWEKI